MKAIREWSLLWTQALAAVHAELGHARGRATDDTVHTECDHGTHFGFLRFLVFFSACSRALLVGAKRVLRWLGDTLLGNGDKGEQRGESGVIDGERNGMYDCVKPSNSVQAGLIDRERKEIDNSGKPNSSVKAGLIAGDRKEIDGCVKPSSSVQA
eukprot:923982-Amphidinium_carterae.1